MAYVNVVKVPLLKLGRAELRLNVDTSSSHSKVFYGIADYLAYDMPIFMANCASSLHWILP
jgi:hypothetical protein